MSEELRSSISGVSGVNTLAGKAGGNTLGRLLTDTAKDMRNIKQTAFRPGALMSSFNAYGGSTLKDVAAGFGKSMDDFWNSVFHPGTAMA